jgi:hypothetical protein
VDTGDFVTVTPGTGVDRTLLLEFFLNFARFEYALKSSGYARQGRRAEANPDWDRFARDLGQRSAFLANKTEDLTEAVRYLSEQPPYRQVIMNGALAWETATRDPNLSEIEFLLLMVRRVRNNLFHGGKHSNEVHETPERTEKLLRCCLAVLAECLVVSPVQEAAYREATL